MKYIYIHRHNLTYIYHLFHGLLFFSTFFIGNTDPNIIQLHGAWVHQRALFFTHDYHPGAQT